MTLKRYAAVLRPLLRPCVMVTLCFVVYRLTGTRQSEVVSDVHRRQYDSLGSDIVYPYKGSIFEPDYMYTNTTQSWLQRANDLKLSSRQVSEQWLQKMHIRKQYVRDVCRKFNLSQTTLSTDSLLVEARSKLLYCKVPKIANTNWKRLLLGLAGVLKYSDFVRVKAKTIHYDLIPKHVKLLKQYTLIEREHVLKNYTKVMFIRNPLERLLSVYRNKIESKPYEHPEILSLVGNFVMSQYHGKKPGFPVHIKRAKDSVQGRMPSGENFEADLDNIPKLFPDVKITFEEFLRFILDNPFRFNAHWAPFYVICTPCTIDYDFIGDFGTLVEDAENILKVLNADPELKYPSPELGKIPTASLMDEYYGHIPNDIIVKIKTMYAVDLEMSLLVSKKGEVS
ncbi:carbohydrate sulfotransferase 11 [Lingula anatina]|uniref:Carbohydrate sulfotransferase n=1 Tax=Lingula anatina TaxID=7574 RepID=A0A1S3HZ80_LINAN|nr:carbohydrate sulfotransferase 11 [Lingula anatina]XP_013391315.1 carbohydrate sulfotransferase 11 [Lingula anatina]|eukprot:XP_013391313.1 carbohydrate sulfotransferase 11 [Lingula anatina]